MRDMMMFYDKEDMVGFGREWRGGNGKVEGGKRK